MRFDVLTLFPGMFPSYLGQSVLKLAIERGLVDVQLHNIRDWAHDKHHVVDDRPYGGGPGMVLKVEPVVECVEAVRAMAADAGHLVMLTPHGRRLDQAIVEELAGHGRLVLLCGRYEGFDERVRMILAPDEISIGDYVLGGGEVAAMVVIDAVARKIPGVLGDEESHRQDSFSGHRAAARTCPVHPAARISRAAGARGAVERRPRGNRPLAAVGEPGSNRSAAGRPVSRRTTRTAERRPTGWRSPGRLSERRGWRHDETKNV